MSANRYVAGFVSTISRSSKWAKEFGFCPSFCPPKVPGSTRSSRSGCMPRRRLWNPMGCSRLSSWLNAFVLTLAAPMNPLFPLSKRLRDSALDKHWADCIPFMLGLVVFIAVLTPFLSYFGLDVIAKPLFFALHYVCAQIPSHSFYVLGHQLGLCARNFSIYASMFLLSLAFVLSKKRLPGIPWWVWVLMMLPMAIDGTTQMFGLRES